MHHCMQQETVNGHTCMARKLVVKHAAKLRASKFTSMMSTKAKAKCTDMEMIAPARVRISPGSVLISGCDVYPLHSLHCSNMTPNTMNMYMSRHFEEKSHSVGGACSIAGTSTVPPCDDNADNQLSTHSVHEGRDTHIFLWE